MNKFFLFGCWNHDNCDGNDNRGNVLELIQKEKEQYVCEFLNSLFC